MLRYRRIKLIGLIVLALIAALVALTLHAIRQTQRDQELIAAILAHDAKGVASSLARGADPNVHQSLTNTTSLRNYLQDLLRHWGQKQTLMPTAMQMAVKGDLAAIQLASHTGVGDNCYAIIAALRHHGTIEAANQSEATPSLSWAERLQAHTANRAPTNDDPTSFWEVQDAADAYRGILLKYGPSSSAYVGLAQCLLLLAQYEDASHYLRLALLWSPNDMTIRDLLAQADKKAEIRRSVNALLPGGNVGLRVVPYTAGNRNHLWAMLDGRPNDNGFYDNVHLALYAEVERAYRLIWRSQRLIDPQMTENDSNDGIFDAVHLSVCHVTGGKTPEIVIQEMSLGGSWSPAHMDIYAWRNGRMQRILDVSSSEPLWFEDLRHDGRYQVRNAYEIGRYLSHAAQPRWSDVYAYTGDKFVLADRDFPSAFAEWPALLRRVLQKHPGDPEILKYLAETTAILNHRPTATVYAGRTTRRFAPLLPSSDD
jgi:tetratricopeptide (TPR) repeat protein